MSTEKLAAYYQTKKIIEYTLRLTHSPAHAGIGKNEIGHPRVVVNKQNESDYVPVFLLRAIGFLSETPVEIRNTEKIKAL